MLTTSAVWVTLVSAAIPWLIYYESKLDDRYVQKAAIYTVAQADNRFAKKEDVDPRMNQIDQNLDFLVKSAAVQAVDRIKGELDAHQFYNDGSQLWIRQENEIKRRLANAEEYKNCLFNGGNNCDASRVW